MQEGLTMHGLTELRPHIGHEDLDGTKNFPEILQNIRTIIDY
jgi:hypothetical protein